MKSDLHMGQCKNIKQTIVWKVVFMDRIKSLVDESRIDLVHCLTNHSGLQACLTPLDWARPDCWPV